MCYPYDIHTLIQKCSLLGWFLDSMLLLSSSISFLLFSVHWVVQETVFLPKPGKWAMLIVHQRIQLKFSFVSDCKRIFCNQKLCIHSMSESRIRNSQVFQDMWLFQLFWYNKTGLSLCFSLIRFAILYNTISTHTKDNVKIRLRWGHMLTKEGSSEILFSLKSSLNKQNVIKRWRVCGWGLKVS